MGPRSAKGIGLVNLKVALMLFERSYNRIADALPALIELCKSAGPRGGDKPATKE